MNPENGRSIREQVERIANLLTCTIFVYALLPDALESQSFRHLARDRRYAQMLLKILPSCFPTALLRFVSHKQEQHNASEQSSRSRQISIGVVRCPDNRFWNHCPRDSPPWSQTQPDEGNKPSTYIELASSGLILKGNFRESPHLDPPWRTRHLN
jgi:hypothetical protein